jgi:hypothetical protein
MNDTMYTLEEIAALRQKCAELQLEGREILEKYSDAELQKICNGIGPAAFHDILRSTANKLHPSLECAAFIHDVAFEESDGTRSGFTKANDTFRENGVIMAKVKYPWFHPLRYLVMNNARRLANYCQQGGWMAWLHAYERKTLCSK